MKNLFTALKDLIVSSFIFTSRTSTPAIFCPECGAMLVTKDDIETYNCIGICEACFIRISDEALEGCEAWYDEDNDDCRASMEISAHQQGVDIKKVSVVETIDDDLSDLEILPENMQYDPMLDKILEYYNEVSADYCESDDLVSCPICGKAMHIHSLQWQNIGECEACYFGQEQYMRGEIPLFNTHSNIECVVESNILY